MKLLKPIKCAYCESEFQPANSRVRFCSPTCGFAGRSTRAKTENHERSGQRVESSKSDGDRREVSRVVSEPIRNDKDLARVCEIDLQEWEIERWVCNVWEGFAKVGDKGSERIETVQNHQVKAWLKRRVPVVATREIVGGLLATFKKTAPKGFPKPKKPKRSGIMLEAGLYDHHFGLLAWGEETGWGNYDMKEASEIWSRALEAIVERSAVFAPEKILFPIGNDLVHIDSRKGMTTAGTPQDIDTRYRKIVQGVRALVCDTVERLAANVAPVEIISVPGNHDWETTFHITDALDCYFHNHKGVKVRNEPSKRKYVQWGGNLIMVTHGNQRGGQTKLRGLANVMAAERPEAWSKSHTKEIHCGHLHHETVYEHYGVVVRRIRSLSPPSAWASEEGFVGAKRGAEAFVFHDRDGLIATTRFSVDDRPIEII